MQCPNNNNGHHTYLYPASPPPSPPQSPMIRCVLVGDACLGKTSLIVAYTTNGFRERYVPTAFDNYTMRVMIDGRPLKLELGDTAGRQEFHSLRPLSYAEANVFLLCFSVARPASLRAVAERWLPELRTIAPATPIVLVGTQSDLRLNNAVNGGRNGAGFVDAKAAGRLAKEFGCDYIECSSITHHNLKEVFDLAILHGLNQLRTTATQPERLHVNVNGDSTKGRETAKKVASRIGSKLAFPAKQPVAQKSPFATTIAANESAATKPTKRPNLPPLITPCNQEDSLKGRQQPPGPKRTHPTLASPLINRTPTPPSGAASSLKEGFRRFVSMTKRFI